MSLLNAQIFSVEGDLVLACKLLWQIGFKVGISHYPRR